MFFTAPHIVRGAVQLVKKVLTGLFLTALSVTAF